LLCVKSKSYPDSVTAIKHPARHYIYYLLSKRIYDTKGAIKALSELGLPVPDQELDGYNFGEFARDILRTRATMTFPANFNPRARPLTPETLLWLKAWKVKDIWSGVPSVQGALNLLSEPHVRHQLELLLLGPLTHAAIAKRIGDRFELPFEAMNPSVVRAYSHYFWDVTALNPSQWRKFLNVHYASTQSEFVAALSAPRSAAGAAFVIAVADKDPQLLSATARYEAASSMAFGMMMHHALANDSSTGHTYAALAALNMMRMADEELERHRGGSTELLEELTRLRTLYDQSQPLKITQAEYIHRPILAAENPEVIDVPEK
jgi:hypothetical protein